MFWRGRSRDDQGRQNFGRPRKETNSKKEYVSSFWLLRKKKDHNREHRDRRDHGERSHRRRDHDDSGVITVPESSTQRTSSFIPAGNDVPDEAKFGKSKPEKSLEDTDKVKEVRKEEPLPALDALTDQNHRKKTMNSNESQTENIPMNGIDSDHDVSSTKKLHDNDDDSNEKDRCIVDCIYFTQRCCECTIV